MFRRIINLYRYWRLSRKPIVEQRSIPIAGGATIKKGTAIVLTPGLRACPDFDRQPKRVVGYAAESGCRLLTDDKETEILVDLITEDPDFVDIWGIPKRTNFSIRPRKNEVKE